MTVGMLVEGRCACGYTAHHLTFGAGMLTFQDICFYPALCTSCGRVVVCDILDGSATCSDCGGRVRFYDDPELRSADAPDDGMGWNISEGRGVILRETPCHLCPQCGEMSLAFSPIGFFD